jgi:hypothetical protein
VEKIYLYGGKKMNDLTIVFYTANVISPKIMAPVIEGLLSFGYPIVSVTQEPMELGSNIVVPKFRSVRNIYRQVLIGAEAATTDYVALCEDDSFYTEGHFLFRPKHFGYNLNRWLLHMREKVFSYRERPVLSQCIAHRESLVDTLKERLHLTNLPDSMCGEPGRLEKILGITEYSMEYFRSVEPSLVVCHNRGIMGHKKLGANVSEFVPGLGKVSDWLERLT